MADYIHTHPYTLVESRWMSFVLSGVFNCPRSRRRSFKRQLFMLGALTSLVLCSLLIVYSLDASGRIDVVGPAGEPLFGRKERVEDGTFST